MSRVTISVMKGGKNVKALSFDNVRGVIIAVGGRMFLITPTSIYVTHADNNNIIKIITRSGSHNVPIDWDCRYIIVWYNMNDNIVAHADVDGRFVAVTVRAWP